MTTFLLAILMTNYTYGQDWNAVNLMVTSANGTTCHKTGKAYNFNFNITLPPNTTTNISGAVIKENYTIVSDATGVGTIVSDVNDKKSIYRGTRRVDRLNFRAAANGMVEVAYEDSWNENNISLGLYVLVRYVRTRKTDDDPQSIEADELMPLYEIFNFTLQPTLPKPQNIIIDGIASVRMDVDAVNGCKTYILTAPPVEGANRYHWALSDPAWLVSPSASLNSSSIEIQPTWTIGANNIGSIRLEAIQDCDGEHRSSLTIPVEIKKPEIAANKPALCYNQGETTLSISSLLNPQTTFSWTVDLTKVNIISGQGTASVRLSSKGDFRVYTTVTLTINTPCGSSSVDKRLWIGKPSQPITSPSGHPTVNISYQGFKNFQITNHNSTEGITGYNWWVSPNRLTVQPYNDGSSCRIWADNTGNYGYFVTRSNVCGASDIGGGAIRISNGNTGGGNGGGINPERLEIPQFDENSSATQVSIYPNPAVDVVTINIMDITGGKLYLKEVTISILDLTGKELKRTNNTQINVAEFSSGAYIVKAEVGEKVLSKKLIIR